MSVRRPAKKKKNLVQKRRVKTRINRGYVTKVDTCAGVRWRALCVVFLVSIGFSLLAARLAWVAVVPPVEPRASLASVPIVQPRRGSIVDQNGTVLATTLKTYSVYADPKNILDVQEVESRLKKILPDVQFQKLHARLANKKRRFVWVKRHLTSRRPSPPRASSRCATTSSAGVWWSGSCER